MEAHPAYAWVGMEVVMVIVAPGMLMTTLSVRFAARCSAAPLLRCIAAPLIRCVVAQLRASKNCCALTAQ